MEGRIVRRAIPMKNPLTNFSRLYKSALSLYVTEGSKADTESIEKISKQARTLGLSSLAIEAVHGQKVDSVGMEITDDGKSFRVEDVIMRKRHMRERVRMVDLSRSIPLRAMARRLPHASHLPLTPKEK